MKYIKLFEQFDEEESWWDEESPFDENKILPKLIIGKNGPFFYLLRDAGNNRVYIFDSDTRSYTKHSFTFGIKPTSEDDFRIFGRVGETEKKYKYKNLPKEIKDRIIR